MLSPNAYDLLSTLQEIASVVLEMEGEDDEERIDPNDYEGLQRHIAAQDQIIAGYERTLLRSADLTVSRMDRPEADRVIDMAVDHLCLGLRSLLNVVEDESALTADLEDLDADDIRRVFMDAVRMLFDDPAPDQPEPEAARPPFVVGDRVTGVGYSGTVGIVTSPEQSLVIASFNGVPVVFRPEELRHLDAQGCPVIAL